MSGRKGARKIIAFIATSADGFIARADGGVDWLDRPRPKGNYGMGDFMRSIDTILWGRKTFEPVLKMGASASGMGLGPNVKNYVFTHRPGEYFMQGVEFVNEPIGKFAQRLRRQRGKNIWIMGGGGIIASFLDANAIDEFVIHVIPVLIGEGISLIARRHITVRLKLLSSRRFVDGVMRL
jgi:dihydrofolate reductase